MNSMSIVEEKEEEEGEECEGRTALKGRIERRERQYSAIQTYFSPPD